MWKELCHALRSLRKSPALAGVGIVSLALGIGANITVYSIVRELVFDDVTARDPNRLAYINADISYPLYRDLRQAGVFQDLAWYHSVSIWNWRNGTHSETAWTIRSSANLFDVLGVAPFAGRLYSQSDEGRDLAVVSYSFWRKRLGADPAAIGRTLQLNPWSPVMFAAVLLVLLASGSAAAYLPARRAAKLDPSTVLREE